MSRHKLSSRWFTPPQTSEDRDCFPPSFLFLLSNFPGYYISALLSLTKQPWQRQAIQSSCSNLYYLLKKILFLVFPDFQVEGALVPGCCLVFQKENLQHEGRQLACGLQSCSCEHSSAGILGCTRHGMPAHPQLLQTHTPVYHTDHLAAGYLHYGRIPRPLSKLKTVPVLWAFLSTISIINRATNLQSGGGVICVLSWEVSGHHFS